MKKVLLSLVAVGVSALFAAAETVTYDFVANDYGLTRESGNSTNYLSNGQTVVNGDATITLENLNSGTSNWRLWKDGLRATKAVKGQMKIKVADSNITNLAITIANNATNISVDDATAQSVAKGATFDWAGNATEPTLVFTQSATMAVAKIVITYEPQNPDDTREPAGLVWSENAVTVLTTEIADFHAPTLTNPHNVAVTYASDNTAVATVTEAGVVALTGTKGDAKITATFAGNDSYKPQEVSYTITVKAPVPVNTSSLENPYTVEEALAIIADLDGTTLDNVYVKGTVKNITEAVSSYGNMSYNITDDAAAETASTLLIFRGKYFNGEKFNTANQVVVGDEVIVKGSLINYNGNTPEMEKDNVVVSLNGSTTPPAVEATEVNNVLATTALPTGTAVKVNYALTVGYASGSSIFACDEDGDFIQLYGTNTLKAGDVIPAGWEGTYTLYGDNTPEITFNEGALPAATEGTFTPKEVEATAITDALVNHVVTIKNVNFEEATPAAKTDFTGTVGETTLNLFNQYELASVEAGKYDVTGVVAIRNLNGSPVAKLFVTNITKSETDSALLIGAGDNAAPVEYYNLQGVRIDNPANGIFIRRQGSKAQKIVL